MAQQVVCVFVVVFFLTCCSVSLQQTPPALGKQFTTNWTLTAVNWVGPGAPVFSGWLALDDINGGASLSFGGEEFIPLYVHTNAIANPNVNPGQLTGYLFEGPICWTQSVSRFWLQLFPLSIPPNATYVGDKTVNGVPCSVWTWTPYESYYIDMWVNKKTTQWGSAIVQILIKNSPYVGDVLWGFSNTNVGPFNPHIYDPPNLNCINPTFPMKKKLVDPMAILTDMAMGGDKVQ